jgi:hypothetical protein
MILKIPQNGTSGFGLVRVSGRKRLPLPPARMNVRVRGMSLVFDNTTFSFRFSLPVFCPRSLSLDLN